MNSWASTEIDAIHLELTDKCNASCPMCARNIFGGKANPYLPNSELSLEDVKKILPVERLKSLKRIYACGNFGDPIVAKDCLEVFKYFRQHNANLKLSLNTNGSLHDKEWWFQLGEVIGEKGDIKFGIDGLEDTHHLYRKGTDFNKIIENASAFIDASGKAVWEYIVFRHNEHQVEQARILSEKLGFSKFTVKKTGRFFSNQKLAAKDQQEVHNRKGELEYFLEKPLNEQYQNQSLKKEQGLLEKHGSLESYLNQTQVDCKTLNEKSLYISSEGLIFPCCWTANQLYVWYFEKEASPVWKLLKANGGKGSINALEQPIEQVLQGEFFEGLQQSWQKESIKCGKLKVCAKTCGKDFDQFRDQYK